MYEDLSKKELEILMYIKNFTENKGYPPTVREIGAGVGLKSSSSVHGYIERLEEKDYLIKTATKNRSIVLNDEENREYLRKKQTIDVPIVGRVAAGLPIYADENIEDTFPIPKEIADGKELFILEVSGESMINVGIMDGDFVLVERRNDARNGDIVLALLEDSATVKTFYREKNCIRLQPENDSMDPILVTDVKILGHIIGLYRRF